MVDFQEQRYAVKANSKHDEYSNDLLLHVISDPSLHEQAGNLVEQCQTRAFRCFWIEVDREK